ncbi:uncharacterized protein LOC111088583 isoform X2 [Limulus polyphemus]|uniref:Uncharacterized protein LOC111088583 isoform X2 n=1 Tax=Limulus polyphemus TaxID=6850 RepID=A0ABM1TG23_LIMPO|nr:uncharacterized protein LOC111088583 isoform X2 [Limulus polyphemus]
MFDRTRTSVARIQADFFRYVVSPLFEIWDQFMDTSLSKNLMENLRHNQAVWNEELEKELADKEETSTTIGLAAVAMEECAPLASDEEDPIDEHGSLFRECFFLGEALGTFQRRRYSMPVKTFSVLPRDNSRQNSVSQVFQYRRMSSIGLSSSTSFRVPSPKVYIPCEEVTASRLLQPRTSIVSLSADSVSLLLERLQTFAEVEKGQPPPSRTRKAEEVGKPETTNRTLWEVLPTPMYAHGARTSPTETKGSSSKTDDSVKMHVDVGGTSDDPVVECNNGCCAQSSSPKCFQVDTKNAQKTESPRQSISSSIPGEQGTSQRTSAPQQSESSVSLRVQLIGQYTEREDDSFGASSIVEQKDERCYVKFLLGGDKESSKQRSWSSHVTRSLSEEHPQPPSKDFDSPAPSLKGSTSSLTSINSRLTCRRGSAPMVITSSTLSGLRDLSGASDLTEHPRVSAFGRRWSIPAEPVNGLLGHSESQNLKNKQDRSSHYRTSRKELVRRHSFGLLETLLVVPASESDNEGLSTGPTNTGTTCMARGNSSGRPGTVHRNFSNRGTFDIDSYEPEGSYNSESQAIFLPCISPSTKQLARRRGSLPADVPLSLMCRVQPVGTPSHPSPVYGVESLQKPDGDLPAANPISRRNSMGEILQVLLGPAGSRFALQGLSGESSTAAQDTVVIAGRAGKQGLPRRGSGGLELFSGFWRTKSLEKSPEPHATKQRMKLPRQSCSLDSAGYPEWLLQPGSHAWCRNSNLTVTTTGFVRPSVVRRRGSVPVNVPLLSVNSGDSP